MAIVNRRDGTDANPSSMPALEALLPGQAVGSSRGRCGPYGNSWRARAEGPSCRRLMDIGADVKRGT